MGRNRKVARALKYGTGEGWPRSGDPDDDSGGGAGVREPRGPVPVSPLSAGGVRPAPEPPVAVRLTPPAEPE